MHRNYSEIFRSPRPAGQAGLFSKEGNNSTLSEREGRRDFTGQFPDSHNSPDSAGLLHPVAPDNGFTLLELIIVLFIVALVFGISAVFFANALPAGKFNAAVRDISSSIRHARALAQINGATQVVTIDIEGKSYGIVGREQKPFPPDVLVKVIDPFSEEFSGGKYAFHFSPSGGSDGGTIVISSDKKTVSIVVDPIVGATVVKEQPR